MNYSPITFWCAVTTVLVVGMAMLTDLRSRRIPNLITFPALGVALVLRTILQGWTGMGLALGGMFAAPFLLLLMHGGKGIGMGDLKLAAAIGALLGPVLGVVAVFLSAIAGGIMAVAMMLRPGGQLNQLLGVFLIGLPFLGKRKGKDLSAKMDTPAPSTLPYGVAIGFGSLMTLVVSWWTGNENWFLSFVGIAGSR